MSSIYNDPNSQQPYQPPKQSGSPFDQPTYATPLGQTPSQEVKKKSGCTCVGCLLGCAGIVVVLSVVAGIGTYWAVKQIPDFTRNAIAKAVEDTDLPPEDKKVVMAQVDRLVDGYKRGKLDMQKLGRMGAKFAESPLMDLMMAYAAKVQYIEPSGLSEEEKAEAERTIQRLARGVIEQKIPDEQLDVALNQISNEVGNGGRQFREEVSDAELRAFIKECKRLADEAEIPDVEYKVDIGAELKKLVDEALGEAPPATAEQSPEQPPASAAPPAPTNDAQTTTPDRSTAEKTELPMAEKPESPPVENPDENE